MEKRVLVFLSGLPPHFHGDGNVSVVIMVVDRKHSWDGDTGVALRTYVHSGCGWISTAAQTANLQIPASTLISPRL